MSRDVAGEGGRGATWNFYCILLYSSVNSEYSVNYIGMGVFSIFSKLHRHGSIQYIQ